MSRITRVIPFFKPTLGRAEIAAMRRVIRSGWLTTGPEAIAFEAEFAAFLERATVEREKPIRTLAVSSGTAGLHLALESLGIGRGDLVAVPSLTFTSNAAVIKHLGADPIFIDSEPTTGNIDPADITRAFKKAERDGRRIKAIIPVHLAGHPCDIDKIRAATGDRRIPVVEDAAHAFPSETRAGMAGCQGDIGVFSFYATKTITCGEGGMVATKNAAYLEKMRLMRLHGIDRTVWYRYGSKTDKRSWEYDIVAAGFKYNLPDLAAALGREQLKRADKLLKSRRGLARQYLMMLRDIDEIMLPSDCPGHSWHLFIVRLRNNATRNLLSDTLHKNGIGNSVHFIPLHRMRYWKNRYNLNPKDFRVADRLGDVSLSLPLWPGLQSGNLRRISETIRSFFSVRT